MSTTEQRKVIDSRGSFCPGPITDLFKAYRSAQLGDVIELLATDPAAKADVTAWTQKSGNELVGIVDEQGYARITVRVTKKR
ncbi:MAG: sulfurtransferase TusA family protein [Nitrososphaerota archaeon]|jgi:TusA-related sulfurtransferase|nr:sulfurtransferase TusA family protein [Nitrososphaerota archaeon]MCL5672784.1 sulfurtransferase TusA family protein [Nitrososphaerota archaeon]MDG6912193.1 sulfurtransferase TusA family protein [Nitrososphaerota archaeon]MDG6936964.1 sulfurtransferase TusA family protein [Nitrososphaerota archaeon]MDG6945421.1 sulfurtransferase TusA family protein [Nitrososphaerota archaeon]